MRIICVMEPEGGVGKTTTSASTWRRDWRTKCGRKVCLIDLDPQGHASLHYGVEAFDEPYADCTRSSPARGRFLPRSGSRVGKNLWLVPMNLDLAATELELVDAPDREIPCFAKRSSR